MSRYLVIVASHFGQTRKIAERIAATLRLRGHDVDVADVFVAGGPPPVQDYDVVVAGSRIEMGKHAPAMVAYLRDHMSALAERPTAFFSVSTAAAMPQAGADPVGYMAALFAELGWRPHRAMAFAGALPYRRYNFFLRFLMKRIARGNRLPTDTARDHGFTDWNAVKAFAEDLDTLAPTQSQQQRARA